MHGVNHLHPYWSIVKSIRQWWTNDWEIRVVHDCREVNMVTDSVTSMAHSPDIGLHFFFLTPLAG